MRSNQGTWGNLDVWQKVVSCNGSPPDTSELVDSIASTGLIITGRSGKVLRSRNDIGQLGESIMPADSFTAFLEEDVARSSFRGVVGAVAEPEEKEEDDEVDDDLDEEDDDEEDDLDEDEEDDEEDEDDDEEAEPAKA